PDAGNAARAGGGDMAATPRAKKDLGYPFALSEYKARLKAVREGMRGRGIDILLVTGPENIYYLSGYRTTGYYVYQALAVPASGDPQFVVRRLELTNVQALSWIKTGHAFADTESPFEATARCIETMGGAGSLIGYEDDGFFLPARILDGLRDRLKGARFVPASGLVEEGRMIKSPQEIAYIRKAAGMAVKGLDAAIKATRPGRSENEIAGAAYLAMARAGCEYVSSQPYVVAGPRSALGHATAEGGKVRRGQTVFYEIGGCHRRYGGAIMRTVSVGKPSAELARAADAVLGALDALLDKAAPGVASGEVDRAGRSVVEKAGLGQYWLHRTGYSIGIGFPPGWGEGHVMDLKPRDPRELRPGMAFHTVPMVLLPDVGAVGFSETWTVTKSGIEVLTKTPRKLRVL
ncbi:MAG: M24 family metallopeptidase, partial [Alphaproteobacteria bacterium]